MVRRYDKIVTKLNDLLLMNHQVGKTFFKLQNNVGDDSLKSYFDKKVIERNQFGELLQEELKKIETKVDTLPLMQNRRNHLRMLNLKKVLHIENNLDLFKQVYKVLQLSIKKYNELLMEMHLPLSLCKLLIKQRDHIQSSLDLIKKEAAVTGFA